MATSPSRTEQHAPAMETHLLGQVDFGRCLHLQRRLIGELCDRDDGQVVLLLCEHPAVITVGRGGSPGEIALESRALRGRQIAVHWVNRGGGCLLHCPGQLAVYPVVPLRWHGLSVGEYLERLQVGIIETLEELGIRGHTPPGRWGVWGRTGQLAAVAVAVRDWVAYYGAYLNVCPPMGLFRLVQPDPSPRSRMSCLMAERRGSARMTTVRVTLVRHLAEALGCTRYHLYTGHPLLRHGLADHATGKPASQHGSSPGRL